jgi:hypothetical protein
MKTASKTCVPRAMNEQKMIALTWKIFSLPNLKTDYF